MYDVRCPPWYWLVSMFVSFFILGHVFDLLIDDFLITSWYFPSFLIITIYHYCAISAYHHKSCEFEPRSWRGVLDTTLCDNVGHWLTTGRWFSLGTPVSSNNKADLHDITEILLKVALKTVNYQPIYNFHRPCILCLF